MLVIMEQGQIMSEISWLYSVCAQRSTDACVFFAVKNKVLNEIVRFLADSLIIALFGL